MCLQKGKKGFTGAVITLLNTLIFIIIASNNYDEHVIISGK